MGEPDAAPDAVLESTLPAGEADRPLETALYALLTPLGIRLPMSPLFSDTLRFEPTMPAPLGSRLGMRFPTRPPRAVDDGWAGPAVPKGWVGRRGAAAGFSKRAIRSRSEPETMRGLASPPPAGEDERELFVGGVRPGELDLPSVVRLRRLVHDAAHMMQAEEVEGTESRQFAGRSERVCGAVMTSE